MVKKVIPDLDSSKATGLDDILVVVLKKSEPEFSFLPAELLNMCLKESCFPDCRKVSSVFRNVGKRSTAVNYLPVSLLSLVSAVFEKMVNNRLEGHLKQCGLFF